MKYLFPNFLNDLNELRESQLFWIHLSRKILEQNEQQNNWVIGADPPEYDLSDFASYGIFGGFNFDKSKGISVNQYDPNHSDWEMTAYTADSTRFSEDCPMVYLEFNCKLSDKSSNVFQQLFEEWIQPNCNKSKIEKLIKTMNIAD